MKKLLLVIILASLFPFGNGQLKAHIDSTYDDFRQNTLKNRNPLRLQNSNSKLYLLNHAIVAINDISTRYVTGMTYSPFVPYFKDSLSCQRAIDSLRTLINEFHSTENNGITTIKTYFSCTEGDKIANANFQIPKYYNFHIGFIEGGTGNNKSRLPNFPIIAPIAFAKLSSCNFYGRNLKNTFRSWDINSYTDDRVKWKNSFVCIKTQN